MHTACRSHIPGVFFLTVATFIMFRLATTTTTTFFIITWITAYQSCCFWRHCDQHSHSSSVRHRFCNECASAFGFSVWFILLFLSWRTCQQSRALPAVLGNIKGFFVYVFISFIVYRLLFMITNIGDSHKYQAVNENSKRKQKTKTVNENRKRKQ